MITFLRIWFVVSASLLLVAASFFVLYLAGVRSPYIGAAVSVLMMIFIHSLIYLTRKVR